MADVVVIRSPALRVDYITKRNDDFADTWSFLEPDGTTPKDMSAYAFAAQLRPVNDQDSDTVIDVECDDDDAVNGNIVIRLPNDAPAGEYGWDFEWVRASIRKTFAEGLWTIEKDYTHA